MNLIKLLNGNSSQIPDHQSDFRRGINSTRQKFDQILNAFNLLLKTFTMKKLQMLYEAVYKKDFPMNNFFKKKILDLKSLHKINYLSKFISNK
jgi:hypothetical protein